MYLRKLKKKHEIVNAECFVDGAPWLQTGLFELRMHFRHETLGDRNRFEHVFQEIKRRIEQFYNTFSQSSAESAENWLKAFAWA